MKEQEPIELTTKPVDSTLKVEGKIIMPEPEGGEIPKEAPKEQGKAAGPKVTKESDLGLRQEFARKFFAKQNEDRTLSVDELNTQQMIIERGILPITGGADDESVGKITEELRDFIIKSREGALTGINNNLKRILRENGVPASQIEYWENHPEEFKQGMESMLSQSAPQQAGGGEEDNPLISEVSPAPEDLGKQRAEVIIENSDDYYSMVEQLIETAPIEEVIEAIQEAGEGYIQGSTAGLSEEIAGKYQEAFKELQGQKDLSPKDIKERFQGILKDIKKEREAAGLSDPFSESAQKVELTTEERNELNKRQEDGLRAEQEDTGEEAGLSPEDNSSKEGQSEEMNQEQSVHNDSLNEDVFSILGLLEQYGKNPDLDTRIKAELFGGGKSQGALGGIIASIYPQNSPKVQELLGELKNRLEKNDIEYVQNTVMAVHNKLLSRENGGDGEINSIEDLARYIVSKQNAEFWGKDGQFPIIEKTGEFNQTNFFMWLRQQSAELHWDNPNSKMAPLEAVGIQNRFGSFIPIYLMTRFKEQYLRDERTGRVLNKQADDLKYEAFMFGDWRNAHFIHRSGMRSDQDLPKVEQELHATNNLTRGKNLRFVYSLAAEYGKEGDTRLGDAVRFGNDFYSNLSDYQELEDILKGNEFTKDDFKNAIRLIQGQLDWDEKLEDYGSIYNASKDSFVFKNRNDVERNLFDAKGKIDMKVFSAFLNFYKSPNEPSANIALVRELVRIKMAQRYGGEINPETGRRAIGAGIALSKEELVQKKARYVAEVAQYGAEEAKRLFMVRRSADRVNVDYGEIFAYSAQLPFGGAADGDINSIGYNADRKISGMQDYLVKQGSADRGGATGIPQVLGVFKALTTNYWAGLRTESGRTIYEIQKDVRRLENGETTAGISAAIVSLRRKGSKEPTRDQIKEKLISGLSFKEDTELNFTANNRVRAFEVFHQQSEAKEAINLDKIVTWSPLEGVRLNLSEFQEQINEKLIKPRRYLILNADLKFSQNVRTQVDIDKSKDSVGDDLAVYENTTMAEKWFGPEVLEGIDNSDPEYFDSRKGKLELFKNSIRADIAGQIRPHGTVFGETALYWGYMRREKFIDALKTIKEVVPDPNNPDRYVATGRSFFSKEDINWIRKNSKSEVWRMLLVDVIREGAPGLGSGLLDALTFFVKSLAK